MVKKIIDTRKVEIKITSEFNEKNNWTEVFVGKHKIGHYLDRGFPHSTLNYYDKPFYIWGKNIKYDFLQDTEEEEFFYKI